MRLREQRLWDVFKSRCEDEIHLQRIENVARAGTPDVVALYNGRVSFVELKARPEIPIRPDTPLLGKEHGLNPDQINWHLKWHAHGGTSYVLLTAGPRYGTLLLIPGKCARSVNTVNKTEAYTLAVAYSWPEIEDALKRQR